MCQRGTSDLVVTQQPIASSQLVTLLAIRDLGKTSAFKVCCLVGGGIRSHFFLNRTVSKQTFFIPQDETKRRVKTTNNN